MSSFLGLKATCSVFEVSHGEGIWGVEETQQNINIGTSWRRLSHSQFRPLGFSY